jgi:predicted PolB exonuclease-like 3'-5' exonuclease
MDGLRHVVEFPLMQRRRQGGDFLQKFLHRFQLRLSAT